MTRPGPDDLREGARDLRSRAHLETRASTPDCLDELAVADFVDGVLQGERRAQVLAHLGGCAQCRSVVRATAALAGDESVVTATPSVGERRRAWTRSAIGLAAAAALVFLLIPRRDSTIEPTLREPAIASTIAPAALSPRGSVGRVEALIWTRVPGADRYRVRVQREDGAVAWSAVVADTAMALPDSVRLAPGVSYYWRVEAQTEWRRWIASELTPFAISRPPR